MPAHARPLDLPYLAWCRIVYYCSDSLETLLKLSYVDLALQDICRPFSSAFFRRSVRPGAAYESFPAGAPPPRDCYYFHRLTQLILRGDIDPAWIDELLCDIHCPPPPFVPSATSRPGLGRATVLQVQQYDRLFEEAARASPYIDTDQVHEVCRRYRHGDEDAALVVLLPLCTKLKTVEPPLQGGLCAALFQGIAHQYNRQSIDPAVCRDFASKAARVDLENERRGKHVVKVSSPHALPFSELLVIVFHQNAYFHNRPLREMIAFLGIPSLARVIIGAAREREPHQFPGWPEHMAPCYCPEIYLEQSSLSKEVIRAFAGGLTGPCVIRQWHQTDSKGYGGTPNSDPPEWDCVTVVHDDRGEKKVRLAMKWEGGNPGYELPWVSWLYWGKMADWRQLDEEYGLQEGDENEMELWGIF